MVPTKIYSVTKFSPQNTKFVGINVSDFLMISAIRSLSSIFLCLCVSFADKVMTCVVTFLWIPVTCTI